MKRILFTASAAVLVCGVAFGWIASRYQARCPDVSYPVACDPVLVPMHPAVVDYVGLVLLATALVAFGLAVAGALSSPASE